MSNTTCKYLLLEKFCPKKGMSSSEDVLAASLLQESEGGYLEVRGAMPRAGGVARLGPPLAIPIPAAVRMVA